MGCIGEIFERLPVPFVIFYPDWRIQGCNQAFSGLTGFTKDEVKSSSPFLYGVKPAEPDGLELAGTGRELGEQLKFLTYLKKKDGAVVPVNVFMGEVPEDKGEARNYYAVVEQAESRCEIPVAGTLECMADPILMVDKDNDVTFANRGALAMLRMDAGDVLGKKMADLYKRPSYTLFYKKLSHSANERIATSLEDFDTRRNRWYDVRFYPCGDGLIVHFRDISLRKHQDWWLRMSMFALDKITEPVLIADASGRILYTNKPALETLGYKKDEMRVLRVFDVIEPLPAERWEDTIRRAREGGSIRLEASLAGKGGTSLPAQIMAFYLKFFNIEYICLIANKVAGD